MDLKDLNHPASETEMSGDQYEKSASSSALDSKTRDMGGGDSTTLMEKELSVATDKKDEHSNDGRDINSGHSCLQVRNDEKEKAAIQIDLSPEQQNDPFQLLDDVRDDSYSNVAIPEDKAVHSTMGLEENVLVDNFAAGLLQDEPIDATQNYDTLTSNYSEELNPVAPNHSAENVHVSPDRSVSPTMQHSHDSGILESSNPKSETDNYFNKPIRNDGTQPFSDVPEPMPVSLVSIPPAGSSNQPVTDPSTPETEPPSSSFHDEPSVGTVSDTLTHEPFTNIGGESYHSLPKPDTPIDLEPVPSEPSFSDSANPAFQGQPPIESTVPGDHKPADWLPKSSSMDVEPPTPTLYRDTGEEHLHAEDGLRARAAAAVTGSGHVQDLEEIPPAPDKPLPPTPGDEAAAPAPLSGHITVMEILLWRDPKKSGALLGTGLVVLISMMYFSFISVVAYLSLALLTVTLGFRLYKSIMGAVQKTSDGHPFQDLLSVDPTISTEKAHEMADRVVSELNCCSVTLKDLFLVKDLFESVKFGFALYLLTYVGACFNTMTLVIMAYVAAFTLPKVYEQNKAQIDQVLGQVKDKVAEISAKVKAAIPMGKKAEVEPVTEEKKEE